MTSHRRNAPIVLVPGIQGRWEWMAPTISELGRRHRVLSFSLDDVPADDLFGRWTSHIDGLVDQAGEPRVAIVGVSFGGLVSACYAARRPDRVSHLVLASAPSPRWRLDARSASYVKHARLALPLFALRAIERLAPEVAAARPTWRSRAAFTFTHTLRALRWPPSPSRMAAWVRAWMAIDLAGECGAICAPTLVVTGEPQLDRVVPVASSLDYLDLIAGAKHVVLGGTGHIGLLSKPAEFATLVSNFICKDEPAWALNRPSRNQPGKATEHERAFDH